MNSKFNSRLHQRGNTLTGIIIGLVIGLSIAVVVALVITKASTPFTNKNAKSDKGDTPVTQMQDPNRPLYGNKDAVNQASKELAAVKADAAKSPDPANSANPAANPATTVAAASNAVSPVATTPTSANSEEKYTYYLQIGAYKELPDAESARAKLALIGVEANVSDKTGDGATLHRVRVGPFDQVDVVNKMRAKLSENSIDSVTVKTAK